MLRLKGFPFFLVKNSDKKVLPERPLVTGKHTLTPAARRLHWSTVRGEEQHVKSETPTAGKSQVTQEILAYLVEHPDAQDTVEGIVEWWLLEQKIKRRTAQVKDALAELVTQGLVLEYKGKDARIHYRMNRHRIEEIRALLKGRSG